MTHVAVARGVMQGAASLLIQLVHLRCMGRTSISYLPTAAYGTPPTWRDTHHDRPESCTLRVPRRLPLACRLPHHPQRTQPQRTDRYRTVTEGSRWHAVGIWPAHLQGVILLLRACEAQRQNAGKQQPHTTHSTLHTPHSTLHTPHTTHCTLHTAQLQRAAPRASAGNVSARGRPWPLRAEGSLPSPPQPHPACE